MLNNKKGKTNNNFLIWIVVGLFAAVALGYIEIPNFATTGTGTTTTGDGTINVCDTSNSLSIKLNGKDAFSPGTFVDGQLVYFKNGEDKWEVFGGPTASVTHYSSGESILVAPNTELRILWAENSTTYYTKVVDYQIECKDRVITESIAPQQTSTLATLSIFNKDGTVNSESNNQTIGAGDKLNIKVWLAPTYKKWLGNPYDTKGAIVQIAAANIISCRYNTSAYDSVDVTGSGIGTASNPEFLPTLALANQKWKSWSFPATGTSMDSELTQLPGPNGVELTIAIDADDTHDPIVTTEDPLGTSGDIFCMINDFDFDRHATTDQLIIGPEDEDNSDLGMITTKVNLNFTIQID